MSYELDYRSRVSIEAILGERIREVGNRYANISRNPENIKHFWQAVKALYHTIPPRFKRQLPQPDSLLEQHQNEIKLPKDPRLNNPLTRNKPEDERALMAMLKAGEELWERIEDLLDRNGMLLYTKATLTTEV